MVSRFFLAIVVVACIASGCLHTEDCDCGSATEACKASRTVKELDTSSNGLQATCEKKDCRQADRKKDNNDLQPTYEKKDCKPADVKKDDTDLQPTFEKKDCKPTDSDYERSNAQPETVASSPAQPEKVSKDFAWFEPFLPQWKNIIASLRAMDNSNAREHGTHGRTMLHFLISRRDIDFAILKDLLDIGVDVNAVDNYGQTPLHLAVIYEKPEIVKILLDNGADAHYRNDAGSSVFLLALLLENDDIVNELLQRSDVIGSGKSSDLYPNEDVDALHVAIHVGASESVFKQILELGESKASLQRCNNEWRDLNIGYWRYPEADPSEPYTEHQPEVGGITISRVGPLIHHTIHKCRTPLMKLLLDIEGNLDCKDPDGATPLHVAVDCCPEVVDDFIVSQTSVNEKDGSGQTPLHYAAKQGDETVIKKLLDSGASCLTKDNHDQTPIEYAENSSHPECSSLLKDVIAEEAEEELVASCLAVSKSEGDDIDKHTVVIHDYEDAVENNYNPESHPTEHVYSSARSESRAHRFLLLVVVVASLFILA